MYLSVKSTIEQDMCAGELHQRFPVLEFLAPAYPNTTPFGEPTQSALHNPVACGILSFTGHRALFNNRFTDDGGA